MILQRGEGFLREAFGAGREQAACRRRKSEGFVRGLTWVLSESPDSRKMPVVVKVASPASAAKTPVDGATYPTAIAVSSPAVQ